MSIEVLLPGLQTTIQDHGRYGCRHMGVPQSGAADLFSYKLANYLLGQLPNSAVLECTLTGPRLNFLSNMKIMITGADMQPEVNGKPIKMFMPCKVQIGDELVMHSCDIGCRSYIAFSKDLVCDSFMGSFSTYLPAKLGGLNGKALTAGDIIATTGNKKKKAKQLESLENLGQNFSNDWTFSAVPGPEFYAIDETSKKLLFSETFTVSNDSNRMGNRLIGPELKIEKAGHMISGPLFPGTLQCPQDGSPILLGPDAQTLGGYPRLLQVSSIDRHLIGQLRPRDRIKFQKISIDEARRRLQQQALLFPFISNI
tara:strand:+ start:8642 stop:9577 length:936 start_codon:yes stop_codon:yes gene_type:complete